MQPDEVVRRRLVITGRVQGVGFRAHVARRARDAGVAGFARNRADGSVVVELEGSLARVADVITACRTGPRFADVAHVEVAEIAPTGATSFESG